MLEVKKVTYNDEEIEEKVKEAINDPSKGESIEMSCRGQLQHAVQIPDGGNLNI